MTTTPPPMVPYSNRYLPSTPPEVAAKTFYEILARRRSVREFSNRPVSQEAIEWLIRCAASAPSGANKQPWRFVCVSNPDLKHQIRLAAEEEERAFYAGRANPEWLADLAPLGTDPDKAFLDVAPWLIVVFKLASTDEGTQVYYVNESIGIAVGFLLTAIHHAGLVALTHTPSPMKFLAQLLHRPDNERPYLLIPVGYPAENCQVPLLATQRKPLDQVMILQK
ncbi:MAG: nitroreductase family protein [Phycisphaeraceae bacterium]|nr:nitroreductase family protein [Phycisphaeraceae bacterium]